MDTINQLVATLRQASYAEREAIKAQLLALLRGPGGPALREALDTARKGELLEVQWEIEEVLEQTAPPKPAAAAPPPPPPEEKPDPNKPLTAKDLVPVYDDPRGLVLHKSKVGNRWFATQVDPKTRQPQTFELHPQEIEQLKTQLAGSPYWALGHAPATPLAPQAPPRPAGR